MLLDGAAARIMDTSGRIMTLNEESDDIHAIFQQEEAWGLLSSLDMYDCNPLTIRDGQAIARYALELCDLLKVRAYGQPQVVHFGHGEVEGYSLVQLIETSLISGHFANITNRAFIDIFSCRYYDPRLAARFTRDFFGAESFAINCLLRK